MASLPTCRAPVRAAYVLVKRDQAGKAVPLFAGAAVSRAPTLNLARIRRRAATLAATEVHLIEMEPGGKEVRTIPVGKAPHGMALRPR